MTIAAAQYAKFKEEIVNEGYVYTFTENRNFLVFPVNRHEVIPFWSSRKRLEKIQEEHPKYQKYEISQMDFEMFYNWLPQLAQDKIHIGVNWSGAKLLGYDVPAADLKEGLDYWVEKKKLG